MGNHSSIIVTFSTIDHAACPPDDGGEKRAHEILARYATLLERTNKPWPAVISPGCNKGSVGMACECVMHFNKNHFSVEQLLCVLNELPWDMPDEVEVFHKSEEDETYRRECLAEWRMRRRAG